MIEVAQKEDAQTIVKVMTLSIQACILDHQNDPQIMQQWLSNKTVENISIWIENSYAFVYKKNGSVIGFILLSKTGLLLLNYVLPEQQGAGIGSVLLNQVLITAKINDIQKITLESTLTAKAFYLYNQFQIIENIYEKDKLVAYLMQRETAKIVTQYMK